MQNSSNLFSKMTKTGKLKCQQGITIISLVITIIILIILATVTINAVFGDNGLVHQATMTKEYQINSETLDAELLNDAVYYIDGITNKVDTPEKPNEIEEAKGGGIFENITELNDGQGNTIIVPGGFGIAEDSGINVEEGIIIEDGAKNQFVWIPVGKYQTTNGEKTNNLSRRIFTSSEATEIASNNSVDSCFYGEENSSSVANSLISNFKNSCIKYEGYYIGRYEQGVGNVCKSNVQVYVSMARNEAKTQAEAMYDGNEFIKSELMSSYAWDTALNFICQTNEEGYMLSTTTSNIYGNIGTSNKTLAGAYEADCYSNIYDFLGNCVEWTTEYCSVDGNPCVFRGGFCGDSSRYAATRTYDSVTCRGNELTFRVKLYIK